MATITGAQSGSKRDAGDSIAPKKIAAAAVPITNRENQRQALVVLAAAGNCEVETMTIVSTLRQYGVIVVTACVGTPDLTCRLIGGFVMAADMNINQAGKVDWDLVVIPGGSKQGCDMLINDPSLNPILRRQHELQKFIAASGTAPSYLFPCWGLNPRVATCYPDAQLRRKLQNAVDHDVVICDNVVTCQGGSISTKALAIELGKLLTRDSSTVALSGMTLFEERKHADHSRVLVRARLRKEHRYFPPLQPYQNHKIQKHRSTNGPQYANICWTQGSNFETLRLVHECRTRYQYYGNDSGQNEERPTVVTQRPQEAPTSQSAPATTVALDSLPTRKGLTAGEEAAAAATKRAQKNGSSEQGQKEVCSTPINKENAGEKSSEKKPTSPETNSGDNQKQSRPPDEPAPSEGISPIYNRKTSPFRHSAFSHSVVQKTVWPVFDLLGCTASENDGKKRKYQIPIAGSDKFITMDSFPRVCHYLATNPEWASRPEVRRLMNAYAQYLDSQHNNAPAPAPTPVSGSVPVPGSSKPLAAAKETQIALESETKQISQRTKIPANLVGLLSDGASNENNQNTMPSEDIVLPESRLVRLKFHDQLFQKTVWATLANLGWIENNIGNGHRMFIDPVNKEQIRGLKNMMIYIQTHPHWSNKLRVTESIQDLNRSIEPIVPCTNKTTDTAPAEKSSRKRKAPRSEAASSQSSRVVAQKRTAEESARAPPPEHSRMQAKPASKTVDKFPAPKHDLLETPQKKTSTKSPAANRAKTPQNREAKASTFKMTSHQAFWDLLASYGWTVSMTNHQRYFFPPGVTKENGSNRKDYFDSIPLVVKFVQNTPEWSTKGDLASAASKVGTPVRRPKPEVSPKKVSKETRPANNVATRKSARPARKTQVPVKIARRKKIASKSCIISSNSVEDKKRLVELAQRVSVNPIWRSPNDEHDVDTLNLADTNDSKISTESDQPKSLPESTLPTVDLTENASIPDPEALTEMEDFVESLMTSPEHRDIQMQVDSVLDDPPNRGSHVAHNATSESQVETKTQTESATAETEAGDKLLPSSHGKPELGDPAPVGADPELPSGSRASPSVADKAVEPSSTQPLDSPNEALPKSSEEQNEVIVNPESVSEPPQEQNEATVNPEPSSESVPEPPQEQNEATANPEPSSEPSKELNALTANPEPSSESVSGPSREPSSPTTNLATDAALESSEEKITLATDLPADNISMLATLATSNL